MAQCPSCQFENMPQYQTCVRCGSILPGSNASFGVEPPRAGKIEKALRLASVIRTTNRFAGIVIDSLVWTWQKSAHLFQLEIRSTDLTILGMFWKGFLPGFAQWYVGRKPYDGFFFFGWLILLFLTVLTLGLSVSNFLLGLVIAWHVTSIIDITIVTCWKYSDRFFLFCIMMIGAVFLFYIPTSALCWNHLGVQIVEGGAGPLHHGDALLYSMSRNTIKPRVGDVVLYYAPHVQYQTSGNNMNYRLEGNMFDRVLAVEKQTVSWKEGKLSVDGKPSPFQPLVAIANPPDSTFVVPDGQCYVVPGVAFRRLAMPTDGNVWETLGLVRYESVYGTVWGARRSFFHFVDIHSNNPPGN